MKVISGSFTITAVEDGEDAVSMVISPQNIVAKKGVGYQTYSFDVSVVKGGTKIKQGEWTVDYKVNGVYSGNYVIDGVLYFDNVTLKDDYTLHYEFILYPESIADTDLAFVVSYGGVSYPQTVSLKTLTEPEIYEIVLANAYCVYNPNEESDNVIGLIEGYLYKIVGTERIPVVYTDMEVGYNVPMSEEDTNGIFNVRTEGNGFFTSGREDQALFNDTYGDDVMGESTAIVARYKVGNEVLAQINVGISQYGLNGLKGERGAPLRVTEWSDGWTYYNGKGANDPYTDVVKYGNYWYLCKTSHRSNQVNHPSGTTENTSNWEAASQFDMIATKVLLAANAHIDLLGSNTIEVKDSLGNTTAGMAGGDGVQLWAGGSQTSANFRVTKDGDVFVEGTVKATNFYHAIKRVVVGGDLNIGNADIVIIGNGFGSSTDDKATTSTLILPDPRGYDGKLVTVFDHSTDGKHKYVQTAWGNIDNDANPVNMVSHSKKVFYCDAIEGVWYTVDNVLKTAANK